MKKDLLIGCASGYKWDQLKYWVKSAKSTNFDGELVLILLSCDLETVKKLSEEGVEVVLLTEMPENGIYEHKTPLAPHVERFFHIYRYLRNFKNKFRYVLMTDVRDVIFQKDPFHWIENNIEDKLLIASSESIQYENEPWGNQNLYQTYGPLFHDWHKDREIYNVGIVAGTSEMIEHLCSQIFLNSINRQIPIVDQAVYNMMLFQQPYISVTKYTKSIEGWAAQLGTTADPSKIEEFRPFLLDSEPMFDGERVLTVNGEAYYIVHQYDRVSEWKKIIEAKYE
jgi:hypothetical protein